MLVVTKIFNIAVNDVECTLSHKAGDTTYSGLTKQVTLYIQWSHKAGDTVITVVSQSR